MKLNKTFQKRSGVFTCEICGKKTRNTGRGECDVVNHKLCAYCLELSEQENCLLDGIITEEEFQEIKKNLKIKYKR